MDPARETPFDNNCYLRHEADMWDLGCRAERELRAQQILEDFGLEDEIGKLVDQPEDWLEIGCSDSVPVAIMAHYPAGEPPSSSLNTPSDAREVDSHFEGSSHRDSKDGIPWATSPVSSSREAYSSSPEISDWKSELTGLSDQCDGGRSLASPSTDPHLPSRAVGASSSAASSLRYTRDYVPKTDASRKRRAASGPEFRRVKTAASSADSDIGPATKKTRGREGIAILRPSLNLLPEGAFYGHGSIHCGIEGYTHTCGTAADLRRHRQSLAHSEKNYACPGCPNTFTRDDALKRHLSRHPRCKEPRMSELRDLFLVSSAAMEAKANSVANASLTALFNAFLSESKARFSKKGTKKRPKC